MPNYRRACALGATYFFTVNLRDRSSDLLIREIELLREVVRATRLRHPFHIDAWVVLHVDAAARRCRLCAALEGHQIRFRQTRATHPQSTTQA